MANELALRQNPRMGRVAAVGATGGALFPALVLIAYAIDPGPTSPDGQSVVAYYATHATEAQVSALLIGVGVVLFMWFVEVLSRQLGSAPYGLVGGAVTAALYILAIGCWEVLGQLYGGSNGYVLSSEAYGDARALYDVGIGAVHFAHISAAAFIGSTGAAMIDAGGRWRYVGWVGVGLAVVRLVSAIIVLASQSHWSDVLGVVVFVVFLIWLFVVSVMLVAAMSGRVAGLPVART